MANNRGTLVSVPIRFHLHLAKLNWYILRKYDETVFAGACEVGTFPEPIFLSDGWQVVRDFLNVESEDAQSVLQFLTDYGQLSPPVNLSRMTGVTSADLPVRQTGSGPHSTEPETQVIVESFLFREVAILQDYLRQMIVGGDATLAVPWVTDFPRDYEIGFERERSGSAAHVTVRNAFPSMLATVQFKLVQGARFRICARKDCRLPFEITSRHKRRFCTQYCAHITSLRQARRMGRGQHTVRQSSEIVTGEKKK